MPGRFIGARCRICSTSRAPTPRGFGHLQDGLGAFFRCVCGCVVALVGWSGLLVWAVGLAILNMMI